LAVRFGRQLSPATSDLDFLGDLNGIVNLDGKRTVLSIFEWPDAANAFLALPSSVCARPDLSCHNL
jgi:hypothetical protein